jgi:hypothetical protein
LKFVEDKMKFLTSTTYYLCWNFVIAVHVPCVLFVGKLPCLHCGVIVDTRQRGVHWVLFVGPEVTFVSELPLLCSHGFIVECCHRGHSCVRRVLFVGDCLCQGVTFVFAWCHCEVLSL